MSAERQAGTLNRSDVGRIIIASERLTGIIGSVEHSPSGEWVRVRLDPPTKDGVHTLLLAQWAIITTKGTMPTAD